MHVSEKRRYHLLVVAFASVVTVILWITLLSRAQAHRVAYLIPFWSYTRAFQGDIGLLREDISNILMFLPLGFLLAAIFGIDWKKALLVGFMSSLAIEILQYGFCLGSFEVDDLINNTAGTVLGAFIRVKPVQVEKRKLYKDCVLFTVVALLFSFAGKTAYEDANHQRMIRFASLSSEDNILLLNGKDGYAWNTDVYVEFQKDGSLTIQGQSDIRSWYLIGNQILEAGMYELSGLSGVEKNTVALVLEYYDREKDVFIRLTPDVGPIDETSFVVNEETKIRTYIGVYPGCNCDVVARPKLVIKGD